MDFQGCRIGHPVREKIQLYNLQTFLTSSNILHTRLNSCTQVGTISKASTFVSLTLFQQLRKNDTLARLLQPKIENF